MSIKSSLDWQHSIDPVAMWAVIKDHATERQCEFVTWGCRDKFVKQRKLTRWIGEGQAGEIGTVEYWIKRQQWLEKDVIADLLREVFGDPFKRYVRESDWWLRAYENSADHRLLPLGEFLTWNDGIVPKLAAAVYPEEKCNECHGDGTYPLPEEGVIAGYGKCNGEGTVTGFDLDAILLLADALEEAGCTDETLLWHLRGKERCPWCDENGNVINWNLTTMTDGPTWVDPCKHCNGSGWRAVNHAKGCWAVELFLTADFDTAELPPKPAKRAGPAPAEVP